MNRGTAYNIGYTVRCSSPKLQATSYSQRTLCEIAVRRKYEESNDRFFQR